MTLSELAEVATPKQSRDGVLYQLMEGVECVVCRSVRITLNGEQIICAFCRRDICILCGCTGDWACDDGCSWILPGVCSTHDGDPRIAALALPVTPTGSLTLLN